MKILFRAQDAETHEYKIGLKFNENTIKIENDNSNRKFIKVNPGTWAIHFPKMVDKNNVKLFASLDERTLIGGDEIKRTSGLCKNNTGILYYCTEYQQIKVFDYPTEHGMGLSQNGLVDMIKYDNDIEFINIVYEK